MSTTLALPRLDLAVAAPVGQRLDCKHVVAAGHAVYPVRLGQYAYSSACSVRCKERLVAEDNARYWEQITRTFGKAHR